MKTIFYFLFLLVLYTSSIASGKYLYFEFSGDTVKIWNKTELNCCSLIRFDAEVNDNKIKLVEVDTAKNWCYCDCKFDLCASLTGLLPGNYKVDVYRSLPIVYPKDSLIFIGSLEFNYPNNLITGSYQSECLYLSKSSTMNTNDDSLFVEFSPNTVKIWNAGVEENCCALFNMESKLDNNHITVTEIDTTADLCNCICKFNLCAILVGLQPGHYRVDIYRTHPKIWSDTSFYIGSIEFDYGVRNYSTLKVKSYQSECLNETEEVVYSNSFESPQDTVGWQGIMDFRNDAPVNGGNRSLFVSDGCIIPHAWVDAVTIAEDGLYSLRCWGKNLMLGGTVYLQVGSRGLDRSYIQIRDTSWTYYVSPDTLLCIEGDTIELAMYSGGLISSAMLVDNIEIVRTGTTAGHTAKYWKDKSYSSVERFLSGAKLHRISADNVNLNGEALRWKFRFSRFINESYPLEYIYLHNNYNDVVYDSISALPLVGGQNIIDEWIDSDAAIEKAELLGGSSFRNDYPDYVINAWLYQALVPDSYPIWEIIYKSKSDPTKKLSLTIDARDLNTWNDSDDNYPKEFSLSQNFPNPFNPTTKIKYSIPSPLVPPFIKGGTNGGFVTLKIYDILGNEVVTLVNEDQPAGEYEVEFSTEGGGSKLTSGIYFYTLRVGNYVKTNKMILIK